MTTPTPSERIAAELREAIHSGYYRPGQRLPTIRALMEQYSVANATIQRALDRLRTDKLIESRSGSGLYVAEDTATEAQLRYAASRAGRVETISVRKADAADAAHAGVPVGTPVLVVATTQGGRTGTELFPAYRSELVYELPAKKVTESHVDQR